MSKNDWIIATHVPDFLNLKTGKDSMNHKMRTEKMLNTTFVKYIINQFSFFPAIDFFASPVNTQVARFISYRPDAECVAIDAFIRC